MFHNGQLIICSFETLLVPKLIFSEYKNINIWFNTAQGWKVHIPNAHCVQGDIHTEYHPSGSVLHFTWDWRAMKSLEKLFMSLNQMVHGVLRYSVCASAKGCGSNVSLSNIKNLLLHAYEFQYLWHSIKRSTVRGRCATVHSLSRWAAIWHIYMDQLWSAEMDAGQRQGAGPTSGILTNWPRYPL